MTRTGDSRPTPRIGPHPTRVTQRLDQRLRERRPDLSWTRIRNAIARGQVSVDGDAVRDPGAAVAADAAVDFDPSRRGLPHARLDLPRLYEDEEILIVDKPAGLLTVPTHAEAKRYEDTVLARAQEYARHLHGRAAYAGVLHRLDRDTSGALAIALTRDAHRRGRELFAAHAIERSYLAVVHGVPSPAQGTIDAAVSNAYVGGRRRVVSRASQGRPAVTHYEVRESYGAAALVELRLETGRQHQIRLHLQALGHSLVGEKVYVGADQRISAPRQMLHAWRLRFPHPTRGTPVFAEAPRPADMRKLISRLRASRVP
jgi:23S rRNA pseudouridine1911/1915/1917 synthase